MTEKIIDINRFYIPSTMAFHFNHSLRPFILVYDTEDKAYFVDLSCDKVIPWESESLKCYGLDFYTNENNKNYCGVAIIGKLTLDD